VRLALIGEHHVGNALAAAAIAHACGVGTKSIVTTLSTSSAASRWRMELIDSPSGVTVLNDAYNANPESMRASLKTLASMGRGDDENRPRRTFAVLGEMLELGDESVSAHSDIGELVVRLNITRTIVVGEGAKPIFNAANLEGSWGNEAIVGRHRRRGAGSALRRTRPGRHRPVQILPRRRSALPRGRNRRSIGGPMIAVLLAACLALILALVGTPAVHPGARQTGLRPVRP
jgi:hypothetical protein